MVITFAVEGGDIPLGNTHRCTPEVVVVADTAAVGDTIALVLVVVVVVVMAVLRRVRGLYEMEEERLRGDRYVGIWS